MFKEEYDNFIRRCKLAEEVPMSSETISFYDLFVMMGSYFQDLEKSITSIEELKDIFNSENEYDECGYLKKCRSAEISNDGKTSKIKLSFAGGQSDYMLGHNIEIILSKSDDIPNNNTIGNISFFKDDDYIDVPSFIAKHYDRIYESLLTVERYAKILGTVNYFKHNIEKYIEIVKTVGDYRLIGIKAHTETVDKFKRLGIKAYSGSVKEKTDNFTIEMTYNDGGEITINITPHEEVYSGPYGLDCIDIKRTLYLEEDTMLDIMKRVPIKVENLDDTFKRVINESLKKCSPPQFVKKMYPLYTYNSVSGGKGLVHF